MSEQASAPKVTWRVRVPARVSGGRMQTIGPIKTESEATRCLAAWERECSGAILQRRIAGGSWETVEA